MKTKVTSGNITGTTGIHQSVSVISNNMTKTQQCTLEKQCFFFSSSLFPCSRTCYKVYPPSLLSNNLCRNQSHCVNIQSINLHLYNHTAAEYLCRQHAEHTVSHSQQTSEINSGEFACTMALRKSSSNTVCCHAGHQRTLGTHLKVVRFCACRIEKGLVTLGKMVRSHQRKCICE